MILGIFLVILGIVVLLRNLGLIVLPTSMWALVYPILIIVIGIYIILAVKRGKYYREWFKNKQWRERARNVGGSQE